MISCASRLRGRKSRPAEPLLVCYGCTSDFSVGYSRIPLDHPKRWTRATLDYCQPCHRFTIQLRLTGAGPRLGPLDRYEAVRRERPLCRSLRSAPRRGVQFMQRKTYEGTHNPRCIGSRASRRMTRSPLDPLVSRRRYSQRSFYSHKTPRTAHEMQEQILKVHNISHRRSAVTCGADEWFTSTTSQRL